MSNIIGSGTSCSGFEIGVISTSTVEHCFSLGMNKLRKGQIVSFDDDGNNIQSLGVRPNRYNPYCASTITIIKPIRTKTNIYAIDSSSVWLGQTDNGGIYAVKCGIAVASNYNRLHHYKVGPIIFYINDDTVRESGLDNRLANIVLSDHDSAKKLIRVRTERSIQFELAKVVNESIMLFDGSLKASVLEARHQNIKDVIQCCSTNKNSLIAIAKETNLETIKNIYFSLSECKSPAYIELDEYTKDIIGNPFGNNTLVKFGNRSSPILRADIIDPEETTGSAFGKLLGNDFLGLGYPESLRLAHYVSKFSATEIECLRGYLLSEYKLQVAAAGNKRSTILGSM